MTAAKSQTGLSIFTPPRNSTVTKDCLNSKQNVYNYQCNSTSLQFPSQVPPPHTHTLCVLSTSAKGVSFLFCSELQ